MAPAGHPALAAALESTARRVHDVPSGRPLLDIAAEPVRYKPGDRCVLRYRLRFGARRATGHGARARAPSSPSCTGSRARRRPPTTSSPGCAAEAGVAWTARPLGVVPGLPLALTEDLGSSRDPVPARSGLDVVHPGIRRTRLDVVRRAARALAELHTSGLDTGDLSRRTGVEEAGKAAKRARLIEQYVPELAPVVREVTDALCATLAGLPADTLRPGHGSYKPSQLMVRDGAVFLVDFDQFCLADPALDVGYFLAYLRPAGLWYRRAGRRAWFEAAADAFRTTYLDRLAERGESADTCAGIARPGPRVRGRAAAQDRGAPGEPAAQPAPRRGGGSARRGRRLARRAERPGRDGRLSPPGSGSVSVPSRRLLT